MMDNSRMGIGRVKVVILGLIIVIIRDNGLLIK